MDKHKSQEVNVAGDQQGSSFYQYYIKQRVLDDKEMNHLMEIVKEELPITFRLNASHPSCASVQKLLQDQFTLFTPIPSLQHESAYLLNTTKLDIRKNPDLKFLCEQTNMGNISRQELVSMMPAVCLNVKKGEKILDMCAAPGSKSKQILEKLIGDQNSLLIANDTDELRASMLAFQLMKLQAPCVLVTAHDSVQFPKFMEFDKILCDVPCSGDGTLRKNQQILRNWTFKFGYHYHLLQLALLLRGLFLLREGGTLVYSTCSLNPIENEAVVSGALSILKENIELVDVKNNHLFQNFQFAQPLNEWKVYYKSRKEEHWLENLSEVSEKVKKEFNICESMFCVKDLPLDRCLRIHPQMNNTGGFFIAVFKKKHNFQEDQISKITNQQIELELLRKQEFAKKQEKQKQKRNQKQNVDQQQQSQSINIEKEVQQIIDKPVDEGEEQEEQGQKNLDDEKGNELEEIKEQNKKETNLESSIDHDFSLEKLKLLKHQANVFKQFTIYNGINEEETLFNNIFLMVQQQGQKLSNNVFYLSDSLVYLITYKMDTLKKLKILNCGLKVLVKSRGPESKAIFRIIFEGIRIFAPLMKKQKVIANIASFTKLLEVTPFKVQEASSLASINLDIISQILQLEYGIIVVQLQNSENLSFLIWKGRSTISLMIGKEEKHQLQFYISNGLIF